MSAIGVLREYAEALRGSWGDIDGRSERASINAIADAIESADPPPDDDLREAAGICRAGYGHWQEFCNRDCGGAA